MTSSYFKLIASWILIIMVVSLLILNNSFVEDSLRICISWTAKIAAIFFSLAFGVSSFQYLFKDSYSKKLLSIRPQLGLSFVVFHTAHLIFLFILQEQFHPVFDLAKRSSLAGGFLAYVFMYLMAFSTFPEIKRKLSTKAWSALHVIGGYWIWLIFFRSYFKNVFLKGEEYFMFTLLSLVIVLRIFRILKTRLSK